MTMRRIAGLVLVIVGVLALLFGGVFWTDRDTLVDAGPVQITRDEREGFRIPPAFGIVAVIGGIVLFALPARSQH
jgi:drug/metabolite transporter (DMT)-like permease